MNKCGSVCLSVLMFVQACMYVYGLYVCVDAYNGRMYVFLFVCVYMHM